MVGSILCKFEPYPKNNMSKIQTITLDEFHTNLDKYTKQISEPIAITSQDVTVGYYIPTHSAPQKQNLINLLETVHKIVILLKEKGVTEDDIIADFRKLRQNDFLP
jgi:hypothetical protein